jgi:hypothetical protein
MKCFVAVSTLLAGFLLAATASGQTMPLLRVGDRVRVTARTLERPIAGRIARADGSRLTIAVSEETRMAPADERTIDWQSVTLVERSEGYKSKVGTGALIGGAVGIVVGIAAGYAAALGGENASPLITGPLTFGAMGVLAGAGVGAAVSGERWSPLSSDVRVGLQLGAGSTPLAVGIRASF